MIPPKIKMGRKIIIVIKKYTILPPQKIKFDTRKIREGF